MPFIVDDATNGCVGVAKRAHQDVLALWARHRLRMIG
jgi:hypothetical protein